MKTEIKLKADSEDTIHVDEVEVKEGIYCTDGINARFLTGGNDQCQIECSDYVRYGEIKLRTLPEAINYMGDAWTFYHIPTGKRITTEKQLTVDDLKNWNHVGFIIGSEKGEIVNVGTSSYSKITFDTDHWCNDVYDERRSNLRECLTENVSRAFLFTTRKELYKWLSEEEI
jgi:hypothetical protein